MLQIVKKSVGINRIHSIGGIRAFSSSDVRANASSDEFLNNILLQLEQISVNMDKKQPNTNFGDAKKNAQPKNSAKKNSADFSAPKPSYRPKDTTSVTVKNHLLSGYTNKSKLKKPWENKFNAARGNRFGDSNNRNSNTDKSKTVNSKMNNVQVDIGLLSNAANATHIGSSKFGKGRKNVKRDSKQRTSSSSTKQPQNQETRKREIAPEVRFTPSVDSAKLLALCPPAPINFSARLARAQYQLKQKANYPFHNNLNMEEAYYNVHPLGVYPYKQFTLSAKENPVRETGTIFPVDSTEAEKVLKETVFGLSPSIPVNVSLFKGNQKFILNAMVAKRALEGNVTIDNELKQKLFLATSGLKPAVYLLE